MAPRSSLYWNLKPSSHCDNYFQRCLWASLFLLIRMPLPHWELASIHSSLLRLGWPVTILTNRTWWRWHHASSDSSLEDGWKLLFPPSWKPAATKVWLPWDHYSTGNHTQAALREKPSHWGPKSGKESHGESPCDLTSSCWLNEPLSDCHMQAKSFLTHQIVSKVQRLL
jgi:hypothetical protein